MWTLVKTRWKRPKRAGGGSGQEWETPSLSEVDLSSWVSPSVWSDFFFFLNMAAAWRFALCLCVLLLVCRSPSLASDHTGQSSTSSSDHGNTSDSNSGTGEGHDTSGCAGHGDSGHGGEPIETLPIVSWKWHHVETPYLVALWVLVSWLCKIGEY